MAGRRRASLRKAWELGNRLAPFIYLGVGPLVAAAVAGFCQRSAASRLQALTVGAALTGKQRAATISIRMRRRCAGARAPSVTTPAAESTGRIMDIHAQQSARDA